MKLEAARPRVLAKPARPLPPPVDPVAPLPVFPPPGPAPAVAVALAPVPAVAVGDLGDPALRAALLAVDRLRAKLIQERLSSKLARKQTAYWKNQAGKYKSLVVSSEKRRLDETTFVITTKRRRPHATFHKTSVRGGLALAVRRNLGQSCGKVLSQTLDARFELSQKVVQ